MLFRSASVLRKAGDERVASAVAAESAVASELHASERALLRRVLDLPDEVAEAADRRAPHRIATYALDLAQGFSAFYRDCQVVGAEPAVEDFRLRLSVATRDALARSLNLLGVGAPAEM